MRRRYQQVTADRLADWQPTTPPPRCLVPPLPYCCTASPSQLSTVSLFHHPDTPTDTPTPRHPDTPTP